MKVTPHAKVLIYNYVERGGDPQPKKELAYFELEVSDDIVAINTQKSKSTPSGSFAIHLAPTQNWTNLITPNSWLVIAMAQSPIKDFNSSNIKMIGRVDTVRTQTTISDNGTKITRYVIAGRDWGQALEAYVNIDPAFIGQSVGLPALMKIAFSLELSDPKDAKAYAMSSDALVEFCLSLLDIGENPSIKIPEEAKGLLRSSHLRIPYGLMNLFGSRGILLTSSIEMITGTLALGSRGRYSKEVESLGTLNPQSLLGYNSIWSIINDHANTLINEVFCELNFYGDGVLKPTLYKRVKPFYTTNGLLSNYIDSATNSDGSLIKSYFADVRRVPIFDEDVMSVDIGTNGRDVINFIELVIAVNTGLPPAQKVALDTLTKANNNTYESSDDPSLSRDGLRPLKFVTRFFPPSLLEGGVNFNRAKNWLPILKNWFFNTHKMLNGSITIIGQDRYIPVGDNIEISSSLAFGDISANASGEDGLIGQIESVSNSFSINQFGVKKFTTTINFSRGVTIAKGGPIKDGLILGIDAGVTPTTVTTSKNDNSFFRSQK
jgi:hypothetical protein